MPVQVALYARVSTAGKEQEVENQLAELRLFAASQSWAIAGEHIDHETGKHAGPSSGRYLPMPASGGLRWCCSGSWTGSRARVLWRLSSTSTC